MKFLAYSAGGLIVVLFLATMIYDNDAEEPTTSTPPIPLTESKFVKIPLVIYPADKQDATH